MSCLFCCLVDSQRASESDRIQRTVKPKLPAEVRLNFWLITAVRKCFPGGDLTVGAVGQPPPKVTHVPLHSRGLLACISLFPFLLEHRVQMVQYANGSAEQAVLAVGEQVG